MSDPKSKEANSRLWFVLISILSFLFGPFPASPVGQSVVTKQTEGVLIHSPNDIVRITVCSPGMLHVVAGAEQSRFDATRQPWIENPCQPRHFSVIEKDGVTTLTIEFVQVRISANGEQLIFLDKEGKELLREVNRGARRYETLTLDSESLYGVSDRFRPGQNVAFYGLGQHQSGLFNYRGAVVPLAQANCDVAVPLFISTQGYAILWNTASASSFDNRFPTQLKLSAEASDAIDYYFFYGPEMDTKSFISTAN